MKLNLDTAQITISAGNSQITMPFAVKATLHNSDGLVVTGPSGSGKSSFLQAIVQYLRSSGHRPTYAVTGELVCSGLSSRPVVEYVPHDLDEFFASPNLMQEIRISLEFAGHSGTDLATNLREVIRASRLTAFVGRPLATLSSGEKRMAAIVSAICRRPDLLLLDEPDHEISSDRLPTFTRLLSHYLQSGGTAIIVTHKPRVYENYADLSGRLIRATLPSQGSSPASVPLSKPPIGDPVVHLQGGELYSDAEARYPELLFMTHGFTFSEGDVGFIEGPNGAGKTTLLRELAGIRRRRSFDAEYFSGTVTADDLRHPDDVAFVPMDPLSQMFSGTLLDNMKLAVHRSDRRKRCWRLKDKLFEILATFGIAESSKPANLSRTQRQIAAIAVFLTCPRLLLLDEPPTIADIAQQEAMRDLLRFLVTNGTTVVMAGTNMSSYSDVCTRSVTIRRRWAE